MLEKYPGERVAFFIDCTALLGEEETIIGAPTVECFPKLSGSAALNVESVTKNNTSVTLSSGASVAAGRLLMLMISAGQSINDKERRNYSVVATFDTSAGNTITSKAALSVLPLGPTE